MEREIMLEKRAIVLVVLVVGVVMFVACQAVLIELDVESPPVVTVTATVTPSVKLLAFDLSSSGLLLTATPRVLMCDCILTQMPTPYSPDEYWATATVTTTVTPTPEGH